LFADRPDSRLIGNLRFVQLKKSWHLRKIDQIFFAPCRVAKQIRYNSANMRRYPDNIPIIMMLVLIGFFTWLWWREAAKNDTLITAGNYGELQAEGKDRIFSWPYLTRNEFLCSILIMVILTVWSVVLDAPLEEPANPTKTPNPSKAPWYFLGLQEMLVYFDPWMAGVVLPGIIIVGLIAIPFIDINPKGNGYYTFRERRFAISSFLFGWLVLWVYLIQVGTFLRGPNWTFYGPFEYWDFHKVVAENNINLSEIIWIKFFNTGLPKNIFVREISPRTPLKQ